MLFPKLQFPQGDVIPTVTPTYTVGWVPGQGMEPGNQQPFIMGSKQNFHLHWRKTISTFQGCFLYMHPWKYHLQEWKIKALTFKMYKNAKDSENCQLFFCSVYMFSLSRTPVTLCSYTYNQNQQEEKVNLLVNLDHFITDLIIWADIGY